jgi:NADH-quinone oxidoreductase subunit G
MATVYVNDKPVDIGNDRLNLIQAAERAGVLIPHYCWHPALSVVASCRMCLVEVGEKKPDGTVAMQPKVVPGCQTPAKDGTVIVTTGAKTIAAQEQTLESLLINHPLDCPVCDKAGECGLQDYSFEFGKAKSRLVDEKLQPPNKPDLGPTIELFTDRCIKCSRCVRFTREISGTAELEFISRGDHEEIATFPGYPLDNKLAGNVVDLCPVGALGDKDFLYKQRVWNLKSADSVCPHCSTGCSIRVDANKDIVYRLKPRFNPQAQGYFMCDEGRYGYHHCNSAERLVRPLGRKPDGQQPTTWTALLPALRRDLAEAASADGGSVVAVLSPFLTVEEAFLLAKYVKGLSPQAWLALGPVPVRGEDDRYPKDVRGNVREPVTFTIRAEKCPNRRGVEKVLDHFQHQIIPFERVVDATAKGKVKALFVAGGYPAPGWLTEQQAETLGQVGLLVVQDLFPSALSAKAKFVLPGSSFAEREGTYVNHAGLAQVIHRAVRPPVETRTEAQVYLDLMERRGLVHVPTVRQELAKEVRAFAALAGPLGDQGVKL